MPEMGARRRINNPLLSGLRSWPVKHFENIRVYYLIQGKILRVVRVLHGRRDVSENSRTDK
jgi:toxin ParE1/3/4